MIRAPMGDQAYWDTRVNSDIERLGVMTSSLEEVPSKNPPYDPQYAFLLTERYLRLILRRYSRGDPVSELGQYIPGLLDAWELSNRLAEAVCREHHLSTCRDWVFDLTNLNHYNWCFWLIGLALALDSPEAQWQRLLALIGGEGEDVLLDRIIASRQSTRPIGTKLLHKKPYARLLKAIDAPKAQQAGLLRDFVDHWYAELARPGKDELWWYIYGDPVKHPLEMGSYFGRWCLEAVAAVKAFGLDDHLCLGHAHYPGDLLRPDGPSTHPLRVDKSAKPGFLQHWFGRG